MRTLTITACLALCASLAGYAAISSGAPSASAASPAVLCANPHGVTSLTVHREQPINPTTFTFPTTVHVASTGAIAAAEALCSLHAWPSGVFECPVQLGPTYRLTFTTDAGRVVATADPTGCSSVVLWHGTTSTAHGLQATEGFWTALGTAMGIPSPSQASFAGTLG